MHDATDTIVHGVDGALALRRGIGELARIDVFDEDGDILLFTAPADWLPGQINVAVQAYRRGAKHGELSGERKARDAIRRSLGIHQ
ncbi:hypothetical protein A6V36_33185 [Paraburkholderia ginsengiterrae]|uniref:DUF3006 domain-containing protein n=1 Tax=Paraburkholderia ginsengiterrae TaxID=1462993 RepID=A0ABX2USC6_9BURK|nr:hypothetical protein [Paraburkholderia ginsengiterrae]OAJ56752.1 hypothetical protein A6V36_33185 [Paraburkholderia ginsengiterrae]